MTLSGREGAFTRKGPARTEDLELRRRRVRYRAWHRGLREMDLIMGRFADSEVAGLSAADLAEFERLIEVPDRDVYRWITGEDRTPENYDTPLLERLRSFHVHPGPLAL